MLVRQHVAKASITTRGQLSNYLLELVIPPGLYWFSVGAANMFGSSKKSDTCPPPEISAVEDNIGTAYCMDLFELLTLQHVLEQCLKLQLVSVLL